MKTIQNLNGQDVHIILRHVVYGDQDLCVKNFQLIETKDKIGFNRGKQFIYCTKDNVELAVTDKGIKIKDNILSIIISKM